MIQHYKGKRKKRKLEMKKVKEKRVRAIKRKVKSFLIKDYLHLR